MNVLVIRSFLQLLTQSFLTSLQPIPKLTLTSPMILRISIFAIQDYPVSKSVRTSSKPSQKNKASIPQMTRTPMTSMMRILTSVNAGPDRTFSVLDGVLTRPSGQYFSVWKFQNFAITQILREINFGDSTSAKSAILTHLVVLNFALYEISHFLKEEIYQINKIQSLKKGKNRNFRIWRVSKIDFT